MATSKLLTYEWDKRKKTSNIKNHGVSFHEASTVFLDIFSMTFYAPEPSDDEDRNYQCRKPTVPGLRYRINRTRKKRI